MLIVECGPIITRGIGFGLGLLESNHGPLLKMEPYQVSLLFPCPHLSLDLTPHSKNL